MTAETKISPAFEPFLEKSGPNDRRDAIVVFKTEPPAEEARVRGRLRALKRRLQLIEDRAAIQKPVQDKLFKSYKAVTRKALPGKQEAAFEPIGKSALPMATVEVTQKILPELAQQPDVVAILPNQKIHLICPMEVDYEDLSKQENKNGITWGLKQLEIPDLWKRTKGKDINVAVLDTGVYAEHPALAGRVKDFIVVDPLGRRIKTQPAFDSGTHGTHVCGTIAGGKTANGVSIGVAPEANLLVAGVLVGDATLQTLLVGISWAVENGADIISMSLGFTYYEPLFAEVFQILINQFEILPVVAIGNENHGNSSSPGSVHNAFSVGACKKVASGKVEIASFSSGASLVFPNQEPHALVTKPDVVAPGVQVFSCIPPRMTPQGAYEYSYMDGTSMATPHVAGVAALLMAVQPDASADDISRALRDTAKHPGGPSLRPDNRWGYGMIQPAKAIDALAS